MTEHEGWTGTRLRFCSRIFSIFDRRSLYTLISKETLSFLLRCQQRSFYLLAHSPHAVADSWDKVRLTPAELQLGFHV